MLLHPSVTPTLGCLFIWANVQRSEGAGRLFALELSAGVGLSVALPGVLFGGDASDKVLFLKFSDSTNSFSDTPVDHYFYRLCSPNNQPTNVALFTGLDGQCTL